MRQKPLAFIQALSIVGSDPKEAKNYLTDKRLTLLEKSILRSILLLRDHEFEEIIGLLSHQKSSDPFVEAQRLLTLGSTYNNMSDFKNAIYYYESFLKLRSELKESFKEFHATFCLFTFNQNIHNTAEMKKYFLRMKRLSTGSPFESICILSSQYAIHRINNNLNDALDVINEMERLMSEMTEYQVVNYLIDKFDIHLCLGDYRQSQKALQTMKTFRKFRSSANYNFMKSLLDYLSEDAPLYVYSQDYKEFPVLHDQIMIIKNMQESNWDEAESLWLKLEAAYPHLYKKNFSYEGLECLFSLCLKKNLSLRKDVTFNIAGKSKEDALIEILHQSASPLPLETVFQVIYGRASDSKDDFVKLRTLVYSTKKKKGVNIKFKKGCYQIAS